VPFAPQDNHLHRGDFERELRNRGVGIFVKAIPTITAEMPNVRVEIAVKDGMKKTTYHTPVGTVWTGAYTRAAREIATDGNLGLDGMIKSEADYEPVIFILKV
jgi:ribosomal protein L21E